jgi:predicted transporter
MGILLAFAPFIVFAIIDRLAGPTEGLVSGALVSAALLVRDWVTPGRGAKILEIGTLVLFGGLALYALLHGPIGSIIGVRLCVDAGLLLIVLVSMAVGHPFTLQYAREKVAPEFWDNPKFLRTNYVITAIWALAFAVMVLAEAALLYIPGTPPRAVIAAIALALVGAVKFTGWYPERVRAQIAR